MRSAALALALLLVMLGLSACGAIKPSDPDDLLPPGDRPARGPGLLSGEAGVLTIPIK
jgi:hypothetical protein